MSNHDFVSPLGTVDCLAEALFNALEVSGSAELSALRDACVAYVARHPVAVRRYERSPQSLPAQLISTIDEITEIAEEDERDAA